MIKTMRRLAVVASGFALTFGLAVGTASALPVGFFVLPGGSNGGLPVVQTPGATTTYQLWVDPSGEPTGTTFGIGDIQIIADGVLTMTNFTDVFPGTVSNLLLPPSTATCTVGCTLLKIASTGDPIAGNSAAFEIGTLTVVSSGAGAGGVTLFSGDYLDGNFAAQNVVTPQGLVTSVPEPGTLLLLGVGMGGLAVLVGRTRQS